MKAIELRGPRRAARLLGLSAVVAASLAGCAGIGTDALKPSLSVVTVDGFSIRPLVSQNGPEEIKSGCPADDRSVTTQAVSGFPIDVIVTAEDATNIARIELTLTGARVTNASALGKGGGVFTEDGAGGLTVAWAWAEDDQRATRRVKVEIGADPSVQGLREIGVRARAIDGGGSSRTVPPEEQPPIGVATIAMACAG